MPPLKRINILLIAIVLLIGFSFLAVASPREEKDGNKVAGKSDGAMQRSPREDILIRTSALSGEDLRKFELLPRERQRKLMAMGKDEIKESLEAMQIRKGSSSDLFRKRLISKSKKALISEQMQKGKAESLALRAKAEKAKAALQDVAKQETGCIDKKEIGCLELRGKALDHSVELSVLLAEKAIAFLQRAQQQIGAEEQLSEEEAKGDTEQIGQLIENIRESQANINGAKTKNELKKFLRSLKSQLVEARHQAIRLRSHLMSLKASQAFQQSAHLEQRIELIAQAAKGKGIFTESVEEELSTASKNIEEARIASIQARALSEKARTLKEESETISSKTSEDINALYEKSRASSKEALKIIEAARIGLNTVAKSLKTIGTASAVMLDGEQKDVEIVVDIGDETTLNEDKDNFEDKVDDDYDDDDDDDEGNSGDSDSGDSDSGDESSKDDKNND